MLCLFLYLLSNMTKNPILNKTINSMDKTSHMLLILLILFKIIVSSAESDVFKYIGIFSILVLNYGYIVLLILTIVILKFQIIISKLNDSVIEKLK